MQRVKSCCYQKMNAPDHIMGRKIYAFLREVLVVRFLVKWLWNALGHSSYRMLACVDFLVKVFNSFNYLRL